jgi:hypothetical protein
MSRGLQRPELGLKLTIELGLATFPLSLGDFACGLRDRGVERLQFRGLLAGVDRAEARRDERIDEPTAEALVGEGLLGQRMEVLACRLAVNDEDGRTLVTASLRRFLAVSDGKGRAAAETPKPA